MRWLAKAVRALFNAGVSLVELTGLHGARWEWRKTRWRMSLESRLASWEMTERGIRAPVRMCPSCRELVDRSLSVCPACGESLRGVPGGGMARLLGSVLPQFSSLTAVFITANVILLALPVMLWGTDPRGGGFLGLVSPPGKALFVFGAKNTLAIFGLGQVWRLVTAGFLHGGLIHLGFNCYALSILGPLIENSFGWRKFLFIYVLTDIAAFTASAFFSPAVPSVGASGPLFGLLGFGVVFGRYRAGPTGRAISDQLLQWLLLGAVMLFLPGIDNAAHAGGAVSGALLGLVVTPDEPRTAASRSLWITLTSLAALALVGSFLAMLISYPANVDLVSR